MAKVKLTASLTYEIDVSYDKDASVWIATSEEVPGLVAEDEHFIHLMTKVQALVPELLGLNRAAIIKAGRW